VTARAVAGVGLGAALLVWPALWNGYPLVFSDTGGFLHQTLGPLMLWDKPYVYGPFLHLFHARLSLWGPLAAQALLVSHLLWLTQRALRGGATAGAHLALTAVVAALTAAPFTIALLLPDLFAPVTLLALFLLGFAADRLGRSERVYLLALATLAIATHLAHLPLAAALVAATLLADLWMRRSWLTWQAWRVALPLLAALAVIILGNVVGHGRVAVSPHGATFLLARLQADGPATDTLRARCPESGWYLCSFLGRLPMDSDGFLWDPDSPVNRDAEGRPRPIGGALLAPEAGAIIAETLRRDPLGVAVAMLRNTAIQAVTVAIGDTLGNAWLDATVRVRLAQGFPTREQAAFAGGRQARDTLRPALAPLATLHAAVLLAALPLAGVGFWRARRAGDRLRLVFAACLLLGLAANAFATGALSKPHHRYQARIVWLLPMAALLLWLPPRMRQD
jgi:hypothetical protein